MAIGTSAKKRTQNPVFILRIALFFLIVLGILIFHPGYAPLPQFTTIAVTSVSSFLGIHSSHYDRFMMIDMGDYYRVFELSAECAGLYLYAIFLLFLLLIPFFSIKFRLFGLLLFPLLFLANIVRIFFSVFTAKYVSIGFSEVFHNTIGQVFIFGCGVLWLILLFKITGNFPGVKKGSEGFV